MKNVRMLLLPVMVIAGSLCAISDSEKERIEQLTAMFHYAAKNCHNLHNPYFFRDLLKDDIRALTSEDFLSILRSKDNNGNSLFEVAGKQDHDNCREYIVFLQGGERMTNIINSHPEARKLTLAELEKKIEEDTDLGAEIDELAQKAGN